MDAAIIDLLPNRDQGGQRDQQEGDQPSRVQGVPAEDEPSTVRLTLSETAKMTSPPPRRSRGRRACAAQAGHMQPTVPVDGDALPPAQPVAHLPVRLAWAATWLASRSLESSSGSPREVTTAGRRRSARTGWR